MDDKHTKREIKKQNQMFRRSEEERKEMAGKAVMWIVGIIVVGIVVFGLIKLLAPAFDDSLPVDFKVGELQSDDWIRGSKEAKVTLIEYGDFQCPACASYEFLVQELVKEYGDRIAFVYRHFPLTNIHPHADPMARAAEAAGRQGKFWEMHDKIFATQLEWTRQGRVKDDILDFAKELELNIDQFERDMDSAEVQTRVNRDRRGGRAAGVTGTPTFFINGVVLRQNPQSYEDFKKLIDAAFQQAGEPAPATPSAEPAPAPAL